MKRTISLLLFFSLFTSIYAQKIVGDFLYGDSIRTYVTSEVICRSFTDRMVLSVSMTKSVIKDGSSFYIINFNVNQMEQCYIPSEGRLLIKTQNDEVIELSSLSSANSKEEVYGNTYTRYHKIGNVIYPTLSGSTIKTNSVTGHYIISEADLQKLFNGVKKIRMEINPQNYEKEFSKDKVGKALRELFELLKGKGFRASDGDFNQGF